VHTYLLFPFAIIRSLLNATESLEREALSHSFLEIARALEPAGREVPSNLLMPLLTLEDPDLQDLKFQTFFVTYFRMHKNKTK